MVMCFRRIFLPSTTAARDSQQWYGDFSYDDSQPSQGQCATVLLKSPHPASIASPNLSLLIYLSMEIFWGKDRLWLGVCEDGDVGMDKM